MISPKLEALFIARDIYKSNIASTEFHLYNAKTKLSDTLSSIANEKYRITQLEKEKTPCQQPFSTPSQTSSPTEDNSKSSSSNKKPD